MSNPFSRYGAFFGIAGGDVRVQIAGRGAKNILSIVTSYRAITAATGFPAIPPATFQGRLVIVQGQLDPVSQGLVGPPPDFNVQSLFNNQKILFDLDISSVNPQTFFFPIAQQEGSPKSDEDTVVNIVLTSGQDISYFPVPPGPIIYIPKLSVAGQTVFGGVLAGQQAFGARST